MLRLLGALLLTGSGLAMGLKAVEGLAEQCRELSQLASAMTILESELRLSLTPTPALLLTVARRTEGRAGRLFGICANSLDRLGTYSMEELWAEAVDQAGLHLEGESKACLLRLGGILGRYDGEQLCSAAACTRGALEQEANRLRESLRSRSRVYGILGLSLGLSASILLL